jgi:tRNA(fMet)-specific endonuclease VapC
LTEKTVFLDTNVIIDLLNGKRPTARERHSEARREQRALALSSIALFELRFGIAKSERIERNTRALDALIEDGVEILDFDAADAEEVGGLRAELRRVGDEIGRDDLLIATQARRRDALLVAGDQKGVRARSEGAHPGLDGLNRLTCGGRPRRPCRRISACRTSCSRDLW